MLNFLSTSQCQALGIDPDARTSGQLTIWFMKHGERILVQRTLPAVNAGILEEALQAKVPLHVRWMMEKDVVFICRIRGGQCEVGREDGVSILWSRMWSDSMLPMLQSVVKNIGEVLGAIDALTGLHSWAAEERSGLEQYDMALRRRVPIKVMVLCGCTSCMARRKIKRVTRLGVVRLMGYLPLLAVIDNACAYREFSFWKQVVEMLGKSLISRDDVSFARLKAIIED